MLDEDQKLIQFCQALPKVELHAHFNGSISEHTVKKIIRYHKSKGNDLHLNLPPDELQDSSTIIDPFVLFKYFHDLTTDVKSVELAAYDVVEDFAKDSVKYLELRTTPKENVALGMTTEDYIQALLSGIHSASQENDIIVKVLLSINRAESSSKALQTVKLANKYSRQENPVVIGIDFSGNPSKGDCKEFIPILKSAKEMGLKLSVHIAENDQEYESSRLLSILPDRIGHGTYLHKFKPDVYNIVLQNKIPLEICMTSNLRGGTISSYENSHFNFWNNKQHPITLCTDDKGIFHSDLSNEYLMLLKHSEILPHNLWDLSYNSIDLIFDSSVKSKMRSSWNRMKENYSSCTGDLAFVKRSAGDLAIMG
ncbi:Adenosine deaminase-like protein [Nymphon striatum]|nr:Adenosine deaminase-like protein [Nymphon striatum]